MSKQHTPEPWQFGATPIGAKEEAISLFKQSLDAHEGSIGEYFYEIYDDEARRIAFLIGPSALVNSSRIVACVNACAGLPGEALKEVLPNYAAYNALHKQRDELLAYNQTRTDELLAAVHQASELKVQCGKLITSLEKYQAAGLGNSTDFFKQGEAYDSSIESLASVKGGA